MHPFLLTDIFSLINYHLSLLQWVSTNVILSGECLAILETLSAVTLYWQLGERDQRCCGTSHNAQGSAHNAQGSPPPLLREKNYSLKNVNSAEVEKPCPVPRGLPLCRYKVSENHFS